MVAGVFDELGARAAAAALHGRHQRRRLGHEPRLRRRVRHRAGRDACARSSSASAPTGRSARTRTRSRSSAPRRTCTRRATSSTTPRSRGRRPSRTCASARGRSAPRTWSTRRASSAATSSGCSSAPRCSSVRRPGATLLLNCPRPRANSGTRCRAPVQEQILARSIELYVIDASRIAREVGLAGPDQHRAADVLLRDLRRARARARRSQRIKAAIAKTYGRRGAEVVERNQAAVDRALDGLHRVELPERRQRRRASRAPLVPADAPEFVRNVTAVMMAGRGDELPVSALPVDGTYPSGTDGVREAQHLRAGRRTGTRSSASSAATAASSARTASSARATTTQRQLAGAPDGFRSAPLDAVRGCPTPATRCRSTSRTAPAAALCVEACPVAAPGEPGRTGRSTSHAREPLLAAERANIAFFETLPVDRPRPRRLRRRCAARSSSSRCSSSPVPARAAARRRT